jgi:HK97 family phage prohead protease
MTMTEIADRANVTETVRRSYALEDIEFRDNDDTGGWTFEGVASIVDHPYPVRDQFGEYSEVIRTGAFNKTLRDSKAPISLYLNHQHTAFPFAARNEKANTLVLTADPHLRVRAELDSSRPDVQILRSVITRGEMPEMSIGFRPVKARDKWSKDFDSVERGEVILREVSIVEQGANTGGTETAMRSLAEFMESLTDVEMSEDEIRRAIAYFETRLPALEPVEMENPFAERDRLDRERLERYAAIHS